MAYVHDSIGASEYHLTECGTLTTTICLNIRTDPGNKPVFQWSSAAVQRQALKQGLKVASRPCERGQCFLSGKRIFIQDKSDARSFKTVTVLKAQKLAAGNLSWL